MSDLSPPSAPKRTMIRPHRARCCEGRAMPQFGNSGNKIGQTVAVARYILQEGSFSVLVRQAMEKDIMIKDFHVSEKGHGSYWMLGIFPWGVVLIFVSFGIKKFTTHSCQG